MSGVGKAVATGAVAVVGSATALTGALISGASEVASYGDNIDKMSQKMGISAQGYQEWDFVMQHCGTSMSAMKTGMRTLNKAAASGSDAFAALGISEAQIASMSSEELFGAVISGLQNVDDESERTRLATDLFGRSAQEMGALLNMSAEDTVAMKQSVHDLGGVMSDEAVASSARYADALQDMNVALSGVKNNIMAQFLPGLSSVMEGLAQVFSGNMEGMAAVNEGVGQFITNLTEMLPQVLEIGGGIIMTLVQALLDNLPKLLETVTDLLLQVVQALMDHLPEILEVGVAIIGQLVMGIAQALPELLPAAAETIVQLVSSLIDNMPMLIDCALALITGLADGLIKAIPILIKAAPELISKLITALIDHIPDIIQAGVQLFMAIITNLPEILIEVASAAVEIVGSIFSALIDGVGEMADAGWQLLQGIWEGISGAAGWLWDKVKGWANDLIGRIKNFFGIHSPSTVFAGFGEMMMQGLGEGIEDNAGIVSDAIEDIDTMLSNDLSGAVAVTANDAGMRGMSLATAKSETFDDSQISLLREQNNLLRELIQKSGVYLDGKMLSNSIGRYARAMGV